MQAAPASVPPLSLRENLRKVFSDHAFYTEALIAASLPGANPALAGAVASRLLRNPGDIAAVVGPYASAAGVASAQALVTEHLQLAAALLPLLRSGSSGLQKAVGDFYANGARLGDALGAANPGVLSPEAARAGMQQHNEYVVQLAQQMKAGQYGAHVATFDAYYDHLMGLADVLSRALSPR